MKKKATDCIGFIVINSISSLRYSHSLLHNQSLCKHRWESLFASLIIYQSAQSDSPKWTMKTLTQTQFSIGLP